MARGLKLVGLTGGIASGKSTVARMIADRGIPVIDADQLAREVVAAGQPAAAEIADAWPAVVRRDGGIDRRALAHVIFADPAARRRLEGITHPRIQALAETRAAALARDGHPLAFYEASLLVEAGRHPEFDGLVVVTASPETQVSRAVARGGLSADEARARMAAQLALAEKVRHATAVIDNDGDLDATRAQVERLLESLRPR